MEDSDKMEENGIAVGMSIVLFLYFYTKDDATI
jgi:hypothetical protein